MVDAAILLDSVNSDWLRKLYTREKEAPSNEWLTMPMPQWETLNVFCPTGSGGGVDPTCSPPGSSGVTGDKSGLGDLLSTLKASGMFNELTMKKIAYLNPSGIVGGKLVAPTIPVGKANKEQLNKLQSLFPGVSIKGKYVAGHHLAGSTTTPKIEAKPSIESSKIETTLASSDLINTLQKSGQFSDLTLKKINLLNPDGIKNHTFIAPTIPIGEANQKQLAALKAYLPPGTIIKGKYVTAKDVQKAELAKPATTKAEEAKKGLSADAQKIKQLIDENMKVGELVYHDQVAAEMGGGIKLAVEKADSVLKELVESGILQDAGAAWKIVSVGARLVPTSPTPTPTPAPPRVPIPSPSEVKVIKDLPGSTGPKLVEDKNGKQWVMKTGPGPDQLKNEADADRIYRTLGIPTVTSGVRVDEKGTYKFGEYIEGGQTLQEWQKGKSLSEQKAMFAKLGENLAADALLANWDVIGLNHDNILVKDGVPYRIDNGGSLKYRAQGKPKGSSFTDEVGELETMRKGWQNATAVSVFKDVTDEQLRSQMESLVAKKSSILAAIKDTETRSKVEKRLGDYAKKLASGFGLSKEEKTKARAEAVKSFKVESAPDNPTGNPLYARLTNHPKPIGVIDENRIKQLQVPVKSGETVNLPRSDYPSREMSDLKAAISYESKEYEAISSWKKDSSVMRKYYAKYLNTGGSLDKELSDFLSAIDKAPAYSGVVYRGISGEYAERLGEMFKAGANEWSDPLPHGFSFNSKVGNKFSYGKLMIRARVKTARPIVSIDGYSGTSHSSITDEMEVIGLPGKRYKVLGFYENVHTSSFEKEGVTHPHNSPTVKYFVDVEEI